VPFGTEGVRGVLPVGGLGANVLRGALPPYVFATLAAWS
jgi:hypothetical protein